MTERINSRLHESLSAQLPQKLGHFPTESRIIIGLGSHGAHTLVSPISITTGCMCADLFPGSFQPSFDMSYMFHCMLDRHAHAHAHTVAAVVPWWPAAVCSFPKAHGDSPSSDPAPPAPPPPRSSYSPLGFTPRRNPVPPADRFQLRYPKMEVCRWHC